MHALKILSHAFISKKFMWKYSPRQRRNQKQINMEYKNQ